MASVVVGLRSWWRRNRVTSIRLAVGAVAVWLGCVGLEWAFFGHEGRWVVFYGRVIDPEGRPVEGKVVSVRVLRSVCRPGHHDVGATEESLTFSPITDADGRFEVRGVRGVHLSVVPRDGDHYAMRDPRNSGWAYCYDAEYFRAMSGRSEAEYVPDARRPAVFVVDR